MSAVKTLLEKKKMEEMESFDDAYQYSKYLDRIKGREAFAELLREVSGVSVKKKDKAQFKFASMETLYDAILPLIEKHGFVMYHNGSYSNVESTLEHTTTGVSYTSSLPLGAVEKLGPQDIGKAVTYFRRYNILALLNVVTEDDDGSESQEKVGAMRKKPASTKSSGDLEDMFN